MNNTTTKRAYWGTAIITRTKDGTPRDYSAVRFIEGEPRYSTEGDLVRDKSVGRCATRYQAVVRAVRCAVERGEGVNSITASDYPNAYEVECVAMRDKARNALEKAQSAYETAEGVAKVAKSTAIDYIAKVVKIG